MDLSVIIVNYNSAALTLNCLHSIYENTKELFYEVIVVDNASTDDSRKKITDAFPDITWIQNDYNAGFARANNRGIQIAKGRIILLLNADTIVLDNALGETVKLFDAQPAYAACGVQLLNKDGSVQHSGARFIKGGLNNLLPLPYLGKWLRSLAFSAGIKQPNVFEVRKDEEVDWIIGAFLMTRKELIQQYGMLDEDFFMYAEEIEWCARLRKHGPLILYHSPKVIHLGGGSSGNYYKVGTFDNSWDLWTRKARQIILSQFLRIRRQWGFHWFFLQLIIYYLEVPVFAFMLALNKLIKPFECRYTWSQWRGFAVNMMSLLPFIPALCINSHRFYQIK